VYIPAFGPPWSLPLEFPFYQWMVALLVKVSNLPLIEAGRWVSVAFFFGSLGLLFLLLRELGATLSRRLIVLSLILVCPTYLFWSRTFMIESVSIFFGIAYLYAAVRLLNSGSGLVWLIAATVAGALAALSKVTTYAGFAFAVGLYATWHLFKMLRQGAHLRRVALEVTRCAIFLGLPLIALALWTEHADAIKSENPLTEFLTSSQIRPWLIGTLADRLTFLMPTGAFMRRMTYHILGSPWPLVILAVGFLALGPRRVSPLAYGALACFWIDPVVFIHVHAVHNYYQYENAAFLLAFVGIIADQLLEQRRAAIQGIGVALMAVTIASCLWTYERYIRTEQLYTFSPDDPLTTLMQAGKVIQHLTQNDDVLVAYGTDWNPYLPYYSNRRALMITPPNFPDPNPDRQVFKDALLRIEQDHRNVGVAAFCGVDRGTKFKRNIISALNLLEYPAYSDLFCDLYVRQWPTTREPRRLIEQRNGYYYYSYQGKTFATVVKTPTGEHRWFDAPGDDEPAVEVSPLSDLPPPTDPFEPELVGSRGEMNIVLFEGRYYGVPQKLGPVDFTRSDVARLPGVMVASSREVLIALLEATALESEGPMLVQSIGTSNIVKFRGRYYGVPQSLGEVRWQDVDVATLPGVVVGNTANEVMGQLSR
jgi:hypothetical protein